MSLPKQIKNSQSGQILIIFLLILVVGLAIVLSIASRTVTDVRQTTTSDESNRAYFAAESGVENALKKIQDNSITAASSAGAGDNSAFINLSDVNRTKADVNVKTLSVGSGEVFVFPNAIKKDDVAQVNLMSDFNSLGTAGLGASIFGSEGLTVYWTTAATIPAIEVSVISCSSCASATPTFNIAKYTFDPDSARGGVGPTSNGFCEIGEAGSTLTTGSFVKTPSVGSGSTTTFQHQAVVRFPTAACRNDSVVGNPVLARIRLLYSDSNVAVSATTNAFTPESKLLPNQGSLITSIGSTPSGVNRKLTVTRLYPALPAIFDYVLYNGSTQPLSKP